MMRSPTFRTLTIPVLALALLAGGAGVALAGYEEGVAAFKAGRYDQAAREFQAFVDQRPGIFEGYYMLGQSLTRLNRSREALSHLQEALKLKPDHVGVQLILGKTYLDVGRYSDAAGLLGKINAGSLPKAQQGALYQMLAMALEKGGDEEGAAAQLGQAARVNPEDAEIQFQYGILALKIGDTDRAIAALAKATQLDSKDAAKQRAYAQALVRKGRTTTGTAKIATYEKAVVAGKVVAAGNPSYDDLMLLAGAQLGAKQYDGALSTLQRAASKNAGDWLPQFYLGQAYTQKGQFASAESSLRQALDKASSSSDKMKIWQNLGLVYEKQKKYDDSIAAYRQANDSASVQRVQENKDTAEYNKAVEAEAAEIKRLQEEQERIKEELQALPGGPPPGF